MQTITLFALMAQNPQAKQSESLASPVGVATGENPFAREAARRRGVAGNHGEKPIRASGPTPSTT
jgi:hypothetical protein